MGCTTRHPDKSITQWTWADGDSYLKQENVVVDIFAIVKEEIAGILNEK